MAEERNLIVGFDLSNDFSQISCYNFKKNEVESVFLKEDSYMIPTVLYIDANNKDWYFAEDAISHKQEEDGIFIENMIYKIEENILVEVYGEVLSPVELLTKFFRKSLGLLKIHYPNQTIQKMVVTIKNFNINLVQAIKSAAAELNLLEDRVNIQTHEESFINYILYQNKDIWTNDVALFEFDGNKLDYYQMNVNKRKPPFITTVTKREFGNILVIKEPLSSEDEEEMDYQFNLVVKAVINKQILTSVFLTGNGFIKDWGKETFKLLCQGRRVFKGQNLYTKGACFAALELTLDNNKKLKDYLFLCNGMTESSVELKVYKGLEEKTVTLVLAGDLWYDVKNECEFILEDGKDLEFTIRNIVSKDSIREIFPLEGLIRRPKRTTRIRLRVNLLDEHSCLITVKDQGFGEIFPTTNRIWEKVINI